MLDLESRRIVGVAFSSIHSAQSMSFIISNAVLRLFLHRFETEKKTEFGLLPEIGFSCNELANESQRKYYFRERCVQLCGVGVMFRLVRINSVSLFSLSI